MHGSEITNDHVLAEIEDRRHGVPNPNPAARFAVGLKLLPRVTSISFAAIMMIIHKKLIIIYKFIMEPMVTRSPYAAHCISL